MAVSYTLENIDDHEIASLNSCLKLHMHGLIGILVCIVQRLFQNLKNSSSHEVREGFVRAGYWSGRINGGGLVHPIQDIAEAAGIC
jgi:hypothetical protein